jgi:flagellin-like protein
MRGITPVITTVLLLLMAVAAVGGAWVWYQRMQTSAMAGGSGTVDQLKKTAVAVSVDKLECASGSGGYKMILSNVGTESTTISNVTVENAAGTVLAYNDTWIVPADSLSTDAAMLNASTGAPADACGTGTTYYVSARIGASYVIRDYPVSAK